jgi:hypothetical protein
MALEQITFEWGMNVHIAKKGLYISRMSEQHVVICANWYFIRAKKIFHLRQNKILHLRQ